MLNRLTREARSVIARAYETALRDGSPEIAEDHLLESLLEDEEGRVLLEAAAADGVRAQIRAEIAQARRKAGLTSSETDALASLGVDVDALVGQIEAQLGSGALSASPEPAPRGWRPAVSATVLRVFEEAERQLGLAGGRVLGVEHLTLAVVSTPGMVSESLARHGVSVATVKASAGTGRREGTAR